MAVILSSPPRARHSTESFPSSLQKQPTECTHGSLQASQLFPQAMALLTFQLFGDSVSVAAMIKCLLARHSP